MAGTRFIQTNFTAGEWTDRLEGRVDLSKYANALYRLENFIIDPRGPACYRPGFRYIAGTKTNAKASRLMRFEFSTTQAYILEFGDYYIRFYRNQAQIQLTYAAWVTTTAYTLGALVTSGGSRYRCIVAHTAGVFATDLAAAKWVLTAGATDLAYEIPSPYAEADVASIKFCQSADVLYLFHASYAPRKLSRAGHTSWTLATINFRSPAVKEQGIKPVATLTLGAVTGSGIVFTAGAAVFQTGDVNRIITSGAGRASIVGFTSTTVVTCDIIDDFSAVGPIASQSWSLLGSPVGSVTPSIKAPVGGICDITSSGASETFTSLLTTDADDNWIASGSGTDEYYIVNTATFFPAAKPSKVYEDAVELVEGTLGSLGIKQWAWGDNDALGYDTIYIRLSDGTDPDTKSPVILPDADYVKSGAVVATANLFRAADVGKYIRVHGGLIKITAYASAASVSGEIIKELDAVTATTNWTLESDVWNATNGYPSCGTFFEERLCLAGSSTYPETVWGSCVGDYENFTPGVDAADSFEFTLAGRQVNVIQWLEPREYLIIGTAGAEWRLGPEDTGDALTPLNVVAKQQTSFGCYNMMPETIGTATLFLQRAGKKVREFSYQWESDGYVAPDLTILAEHITAAGIRGMAYQQEPASILWAFDADGALIAMTYLRDQDVVGWHQHPMGTAEVESLACIPGTGYDELWAIIKRTVNGATVRYIEMMEEVFDDTAADYITNKGLNAFFVDSGITYNGASTTTITGLTHLEGETVAILADGNIQANKVVAAGQITLSLAASVVHVGLAYTGLMQPMRLDAALKDGSAQGRLKKLHEVYVRVYRSGTFKVGRDIDHLDVVIDRERVITLGAPYDLFTGDLPVGYDDSWESDARVMIVQDKPMPLTVVAIMPEVSIT